MYLLNGSEKATRGIGLTVYMLMFACEPTMLEPETKVNRESDLHELVEPSQEKEQPFTGSAPEEEQVKNGKKVKKNKGKKSRSKKKQRTANREDLQSDDSVSEESQAKKEGELCQDHADCLSGVCKHIKKEYRLCAAVNCKTGSREDNNNFFCNRKGKWKPTKKTGQACKRDYECYEPSCYMDPSCDTRPRQKGVCENKQCSLKTVDTCPKAMTRVLHKGEYMIMEDGKCMESIAQRVLTTVCVPCGNGVCDPDESRCNCPKDCKE